MPSWQWLLLVPVVGGSVYSLPSYSLTGDLLGAIGMSLGLRPAEDTPVFSVTAGIQLAL